MRVLPVVSGLLEENVVAPDPQVQALLPPPTPSFVRSQPAASLGVRLPFTFVDLGTRLGKGPFGRVRTFSRPCSGVSPWDPWTQDLR